jgi:hypothetical protein
MATSMQAHEGHAIYSPSGELSNFLAGAKAGPDHKWRGLGPALCIAGAATGNSPSLGLCFAPTGARRPLRGRCCDTAKTVFPPTGSHHKYHPVDKSWPMHTSSQFSLL